MELLFALAVALLCSFTLNVYLYMLLKKRALQIEDLNKVKKEVLSIEAQQILHDMTAHGQSIIRIVPMSPSDVFWRRP